MDAVEYQDEYDKHLSLHLNGTCEWILNHPVYENWQASESTDGGAKFLWIHGPAGFGKTVLSAWLISHIRQTSKIPIAHYFSSSHAQRSPDLECIVRSWITQLAQSSVDVLDLCQTARRKQSARRASRHEVWNVLTEILAHIPSCILVLDGLDELPNVNDAKSLFLKSLKKAVTLKNVKLLITSRHEVDIASEISVSASQPPKLLMLECKISNEDVRRDVHQYSQSAVARKFPKQSESFRKDISARMAENSGGMFLWVKLQQCQLRGSQSNKTVERIVEGMPLGLYQTYNRNWSSIQELAEPDRNRAIDILRWLTFGYRAFTVKELAEALVIELDGASNAFCEDDLPVDMDDEYICNEIKGLCFSLVDIREGRQNPSPMLASSSIFVAPGSKEKKNRAVECICGFLYDDGHMVMCAHCRTWQHTECYYFEKGEVSDVNEIMHRCEDCEPRQLDARGATEHQRMRRRVTQTALRHLETETIAKEPDTVRLVHISVRDYLVATLPVPTMLKPLRIKGLQQNAPHHAMLAAYCLQFLNCPQAWSGSDDVDSRAFSAYAVHSWFWHLHDAGAYYGSVSGLVHTFMKPGNINFANWRTRYETDLCIEWNEPVRRTNHSAMYYACSFGLLHTMDFLRNNEDEDIDSVGGLFGTALQAACSRGYNGAFDRLMRWGADVTVEGGRHHSAINAAAYGGQYYMVQALLDREARTDIPTIHNSRIWGATRMAARQGHEEVVKLLIDHIMATVPEGKNNKKTSAYLSGLSTEVAAAGYAGILKLLLDRGADIEARDHNSNTLLHRAAANNDLELTADLIRRGASVGVRGEQDYTPLHFSAGRGHVDVVACLLAHGADINAQTKSGRTALYIALDQGYPDLARFLLGHRANVNIATAEESWHPIHLAAERGLIDVLPPLIERGAVPNSQSSTKQSPLHTAAACGQRAAVELLLQRGAEISSDSNGTTPLHISTHHADLEITTLLLQSGADPNARVQLGDTPLHMIVSPEDKEEGKIRLEQVGLLLEHGAVQSPNDSGWTPLHYAVKYGQNDMVTLFLDRGCHIDVQTKYGQTPLYLALSNHKIDTADLLFRRGADAKIATLGGETSLFPAIRIGNMAMVRSLISRGCEISAKSNVAVTALRGAIGRASDELVEYLIVQGADMFTIDEYQMTCSNWLRRLRPHLLQSQQIAQRLDKDKIGPDIAMLRRHTYELAVIIRRDYGRKKVKLACFINCLLMLGMEDDARLAYQLKALVPAYCSSVSLCDGCDDVQIRKGASYHCKSCPDTDLCQECMTKHKEKPVLNICRGHEFMRAVASEARIRPDQTKALDRWLCGIEERLRPT